MGDRLLTDSVTYGTSCARGSLRRCGVHRDGGGRRCGGCVRDDGGLSFKRGRGCIV